MYTTPLIKPCKDCPYRKGTLETLETLHVELEWFSDGKIQHACHHLTNDYTAEEDLHLGCLGSKLFAEKLQGINHIGIKDLNEII